jgi:Fur family ferric uptake transcriptional regulator
MRAIEHHLRDSGYKFTTPRQVVAAVLESEADHLTANEIWERVQQQNDTIGRMTVYRTLELFTEIGYIRPAPQAANDARSGLVYVVMRDGHHHHVICQRCGSVIEFADCGLDDLIAGIEAKYDCEIDGHLLEFYGTCADCREHVARR